MFSRVRDAAFFVRSQGSGDPTLVATGALTVGPEVLHDVTDPLSRRMRVVAVDQRGAGRTQGPTAGMTLDTLADDLLAVLADLGIDRCVHVTESAGCAVALVAAARRPEFFSGLVLCAPGNWWLDPPESRPEWTREPAPPPEALGEMFADLAATSLSDTDDPVLIGWAQTLFADDWEALMDWNELSLGADLRSVAPRVTVPTLVIHGDADAVSSVDGSRRLVEALPRGELVVIEGAGHVPSATRADEVLDAVEAFLAGLTVDDG